MVTKKFVVALFGLMLICSFGFAQGTRIWLRTFTGPLGHQGLGYNPNDNRVYYCHYYLKVINIISSDSNITSYGSFATPNNDSGYTDIKYCAYDNTLWLLSNRLKRVYKVTTTGTVRRYFNISAVDYPAGLAWDEATRTIYISDRRTSLGVFPQYIFVFDTLGNQIRRMDHPIRGYYGARGLAFRPRSGNMGPWLLNAYTFWNSGGTAVDSAGIFALDPATCRVLNYFRIHPLPETSNIRGVEFDPRNNTYWVTYTQYGT
ncbi:MAG: hypothetical protein ABIL05_00020 [candidate division WOR-3 bacterium]